MEQKDADSLLRAMILLQSVVLSCVDHKQFPFTRTQLTIFTVLAMEGELTMKKVSQYIASSKEQATRAVAPLADAGYITRRTDPSNRTHVYVSLTDSGRQLLKDNQIMITERLTEKLNAALSDKDKDDLYEASARIVTVLSKNR